MVHFKARTRFPDIGVATACGKNGYRRILIPAWPDVTCPDCLAMRPDSSAPAPTTTAPPTPKPRNPNPMPKQRHRTRPVQRPKKTEANIQLLNAFTGHRIKGRVQPALACMLATQMGTGTAWAWLDSIEDVWMLCGTNGTVEESRQYATATTAHVRTFVQDLYAAGYLDHQLRTAFSQDAGGYYDRCRWQAEILRTRIAGETDPVKLRHLRYSLELAENTGD